MKREFERHNTMSRHRSTSFANIDESQASGVLLNVLREHKVHLGGSAMGKGLRYAARYWLTSQKQHIRAKITADRETKDSSFMFEESCLQHLPEEPFYVVDIAVTVSQVYQWRKYFPRVDVFYAVKCNPDFVILRTLAILGCHFDCASRNEIHQVLQASIDLPNKPEIIFANPCKGRAHIIEAVRCGVQFMTFDNIPEIIKCASISKQIKLVLRIVTDDRGSQCRLSSKYGAPQHQWRLLLQAAKEHGLQVVGVSFHVGSGCRDAALYEAALKDAKKVFDLAEQEFGFRMTLLDIGGGFPGETHSIWNPAAHIDDIHDDDESGNEGLDKSSFHQSEERFLFFQEIAARVAPIIDELFPEHVRVIGEPGRYLVAAAATLVASVIGERTNAARDDFRPDPVNNREAAAYLDSMTRQDEDTVVRKRGMSIGSEPNEVLDAVVDELADYSRLYARQNLAQQEFDVYNDDLDLYREGFETASDLLGPPEPHQKGIVMHSAEGINKPLATDGQASGDCILSLAAAGEAAINGVMLQSLADSAPFQDDYAYYINDGVYGAFNNVMFDHATVRPRKLHHAFDNEDCNMVEMTQDGVLRLRGDKLNHAGNNKDDVQLFASTVFGPTCDSIDVIARSVLLPKLQIGDWLYFQNMGAYTMAAASSFNGFTPTDIFYVCSVQPEFFEQLIAGPDESEHGESENERQNSVD